MASPLSVFRKYQSIMLVVFGVMLMIAFVVLPPLDKYLQTRGAPSVTNDVVVKWNGGSFRESELESLRLMHRVAVSYLFAVVAETQRKEGVPRGVRYGAGGQVVDPGIPANMSDETLVQTHLLAQQAEDMGVVVSDEAIQEFLDSLCDDRLSRRDLADIFAQGLGDSFNDKQLFNQLRIELLAQRMRTMAQAGLLVAPFGAVPPGKAWEYFTRLHRRVKAELVSLPVSDFNDQVGEPKDADLEAIFEEGKNRFPNPDSPEPGFKRRRKVAFQFVRADFSKLIEDEKANFIDKVTDEEIKTYYEENKERYRELELPTESESTEPTDAGQSTTEADASTDSAKPDPGADDAPAPPATDPAGDDSGPQPPKPPQPPQPPQPNDSGTKTDEPAAESPAVPTGDAGDASEAPASPAKPTSDGETATGETATGETATPPRKADVTDEAPAADDEPAPNDPAPEPEKTDGSTREVNREEFFVSAQATEQEQPEQDVPTPEEPAKETPEPATETEIEVQPADASQEPADDTPPSDAPKSDAPTADAANAAEAPQAAPKAEAKLPQANDTDSEAKAEDPPSAPTDDAGESTEPKQDEPKTGEAAPATDTPAETPAKYRPLDDELRQEIRDELAETPARKAAQERLDKAKAEIEKIVNRHAAKFRSFTSNEKEKQTPSPLDIDEIAEEMGLVADITPLVDSLEIRDFEIGSASVFDFSGGNFQQFYFYDLAFGENVPLYDPMEIRGENNVEFLFWRTEVTEPLVPNFEQAREEVVAAWTRQQALTIAKKEGEKLVQKITKSQKPIGETLDTGNFNVIETNEFSWMSTGATPMSMGAPAISNVPGVEGIGPDFMKDVFALQVGEVGIAVNQPRTIVYVVRISSETPTEEVLRENFLASGVSREVEFIAYSESTNAIREWYQDLESSLGVTWLREPSSSGT